jgi:Icc-related predicted phosphoesterase
MDLGGVMSKIRVACCSDLHGKLPKIEPCDILLISGDICPHFMMPSKFGGYPGDIDDTFGQAKWLGSAFSDWLDTAPAKEKVLTWGNHDWVAYKRPHMVPKLRAHVLVDAGVEVMGLKIWGSPWQIYFHNWAYNSPPRNQGGEEFLAKKWAMIPDDTNIIVCHGPPHGYGDLTDENERTGSTTLTERILAIKPKLTVHGHIHSGRGQWTVDNTIICNASVLNEEYKLVHQPMYFDL